MPSSARRSVPALDTTSMTMGYFRLILQRFGDTPERRAALLEGTGVSDATLGDPAGHIDFFQQVRQFENANTLFGQGWALSEPEIWGHMSHGTLGLASVTAPTIEKAIEIVARYSYVRAPFNQLRVTRSASHVTIEYMSKVPLDAALWRPILEIGFLGLRSVLSAVLAQFPLEIEFSYACPPPSYAERITQVFGPRVSFNAERNTLRMPRSYLTAQSPFADAGLHDHAVAQLERLYRLLQEPEGIRRRVEHLLVTMPVGRFDEEGMAFALGLSRRTLVRRLSETGAGFRELLDSELKRRAVNMLNAGLLSRAEIGAQLGYADATSFSRACRRWFASS